MLKKRLISIYLVSIIILLFCFILYEFKNVICKIIHEETCGQYYY
jgi:hypothetical protein